MNSVQTAARAPSGERSDADSRPLGEIANDIVQKAESLVRQELKLGIADAEERLSLLKREVFERTDYLKAELLTKLSGGAVLFAGTLTLIAALTLLLAKAIQPWLAALVIGVLVCVAGFVMLKRSVRAKPPLPATELLPTRAVESTKEDIHAIEEAIHE